jgi:hypothetical protein
MEAAVVKLLESPRLWALCAGLLASILFLNPVKAGSVAIPDKLEATYPVLVAGKDLAELIGKDIAGIRLFALRNGVMDTIPLQIDQRDAKGNWVWQAIVSPDDRYGSEYAIDKREHSGRKFGRTYDNEDPDGKPLLDDNDLLVFMSQDAGERIRETEPLLSKATATAEIEVTDPVNGTRSWVYAAYYASDPPPLSPVRYLSYDADSGRIISPVYEMTFSDRYAGVMVQLSVGGRELLDRTKIRGTLRLGVSRFGKDFRFTENNIEGYVYGYTNGPVRVVRRTIASLRLGPVSSSTIACDQIFYPDHSEIPVRLPVNFFLHSASLHIAADYHDSPFLFAYTNASHVPIRLRDHSSYDNLLKGSGNASWVALTGEDVSVVSMLTVPESIRQFTQVTPTLVYNRAMTDPPESFSGVEPEAGYLIETRPAFPRGTYLLVGTYLYLPRSFSESDARRLYSLAGGTTAYKVTRQREMRKFTQETENRRPSSIANRRVSSD